MFAVAIVAIVAPALSNRRKPVSLLALSVHVHVIDVLLADVPAKLLGAVGTVTPESVVTDAELE